MSRTMLEGGGPAAKGPAQDAADLRRDDEAHSSTRAQHDPAPSGGAESYAPTPYDRAPRGGADLYAPTLAEVDLGRLRANLEIYRSLGPEVLAVVKADAYGHGAVPVARALDEAGVRWFGVATAEEGIALRRAGLERRTLVFAAPLPEYVPAYATYDLDLTVCSRDVAEVVADVARRAGPIRVHVKIETGMGRLGILPEEAGAVMSLLERARNVEVAGLWTHLATADDAEFDFAIQQLDRFDAVVKEVGDAVPWIHAGNSPAALRIPERFAFERSMIRAGIGLYGYTGLAGLAAQAGLRPVMRLLSRVTHVRQVDPGTTVSYGRRWKADRRTRIAVIGAGYGDGYPRLLSASAVVGIRGMRHPVAGTVCMDVLMADVGANSLVGVGDDVVLFGEGGPDAFELGEWAQTIPYEILTRVSARVPRVYVQS